MSESPGRRAANQADVNSVNTPVEDDNAEKDHFLQQVEARDLIEFGMIPVSTPQWALGGSSPPTFVGQDLTFFPV